MIFQSLLLGIHLVCVNVAAAGPLLCPFVQWSSAKAGDAALARAGKRLATASLVMFLIGGVTGFIQGLLWWSASEQRLTAAMSRLSSKIHFGLWELGFFVVCLAIYLAWWRWAPPRSAAGRLGHALLAWMAATNLLWHFPPLMTILSDVAANAPTGEPITSADFRRLMFSADILPRCVHVWLASLAASGMMLSLLAALERRASAGPLPLVERAISSGGRIALVATLLQALVGAWVLFSSPTDQQARLMGGSWQATLLLVASIAAALWLLHSLGAIAIGPVEIKQVFQAAALMAFVIFAMSATLIVARGSSMQAPLEAQQRHYSSPNRIWQ